MCKFTATPISNPPPAPTPTPRALSIEASKHLTLSLYHLPPTSAQFSNWFNEQSKIRDPYFAARLKQLCTDRAQTLAQQHDILVAKMSLTGSSSSGDSETFARVLVLYDERVRYIQEAATARITLWAEWYAECQKCDVLREDGFIAACESTILWMENDYILRLQNFVGEVYALMVRYSYPLAKMVLEGLVGAVGRGREVEWY